jgi:hypothetical protein
MYMYMYSGQLAVYIYFNFNISSCLNLCTSRLDQAETLGLIFRSLGPRVSHLDQGSSRLDP